MNKTSGGWELKCDVGVFSQPSEVTLFGREEHLCCVFVALNTSAATNYKQNSSRTYQYQIFRGLVELRE